MKCENCGNDHIGNYGSGRFCSDRCAKGFSTKAKRKEIDKKTSFALSGRTKFKKIKIICPYCKTEFEVLNQNNHKIYCSKSCVSRTITRTPEYRELKSKLRIKAIIDGKTNSYGHKMIYQFKGADIKCDSMIEYTCLDYFEKLGATEIIRCNFWIEYDDAGITRRYNPDFKISVNEKTYIVEVKSYLSKSSDYLNEKWRDYNRKSELKKEALKKYCELNMFESFWFTKDKNIKKYQQLIKGSVA